MEQITNSADDYSNLGERQIFYIVNVPGETAWAKKVSLESESV